MYRLCKISKNKHPTSTIVKNFFSSNDMRKSATFSPKNKTYRYTLHQYYLPFFDKVHPVFICSITLINYYKYIIIK